MKPTDILAAQSGTEGEEQPIRTEIIKHKPKEGSPFTIITRESGVMLTMGKYQVSPELESEEELEEWIITHQWSLVTSVATIVHEALE